MLSQVELFLLVRKPYKYSPQSRPDPRPARSLTVVPVLCPTASRRGEQDPAGAIEGGIQQRVYVAVKGGCRPPVANDVGETAARAPPDHRPPLPAIGGPPVQDLGAHDGRAGGGDHQARGWQGSEKGQGGTLAAQWCQIGRAHV